MRVTSSMYYKSIYQNNNARLNKELFDVNRQIASQLKIQYAKDDVEVFAQTMRLDNEMTVLSQIKKSAESGYKISNQSDTVLNEFSNNMTKMKTLLIQAANASNDETSLDAIASELRGLEKNLRVLANTSINGQYLFAGSSIDTPPIAEDGTYTGNDIAMKAFLDTNIQQQYNITGSDLFLGEEVLNNREITSNVINKNLLADYVDLQASPDDLEPLSATSTIRQLMGDTDSVADTTNKHFFYVRGTSSDGTAFKSKISMNDTQTVQDLLNNIGDLYGNTPNLKLVNVTMNSSGQIVVEDKQSGSSKLDFHMVGAVDFSGGTAADVTDIDALDSGETNFQEIIDPTTPPANSLFVKEFVKSGFTPVAGAASNIEGLVYDRTEFSKNGATLSSNVSQIVGADNSFASDTTKLSEVFSGALDGKVLKLEGMQINGTTPFDVSINLLDTGSTFTIGGNTYDFFDVAGNSVPAEEMTYRQFMDVVNVVVTGGLPDGAYGNTANEFHAKVEESTLQGTTFLSYDGRVQFGQQGVTQTAASLAIYDSNSNDFTAPASIATFNSNNALTVTDPKTDLFKTIDMVIKAVEEYKEYPDASRYSERSVGIQNGIAMIDELLNHVTSVHTVSGANSNTLNKALERTQTLEISTMTLRSSIIDTDLAEASLRLSQLSLNYQVMLSSVGKISQLSLVNYL
ncbi:MAG: flagellar biosynthesis protein FlgL [Campylobacterales bacterium]|nr:flagellar biosynthesis protein FlgL [Campylobacterales bacterium]